MYPPVPPLDDRSQLIRDNMPLVELVVQRMVPQVPSFMTREDMISAAMVGLIDAANKFDLTKGVKFRTFAEHRVRGAILDDGRRPLDVAHAGRMAIDDAESATPSALRFAKHYPVAVQADRGPTCAWCTKTRRGHDSIVKLGDPHEFAPTGVRP